MTETIPLALHRWDRPVDASDQAVLAHCVGPTIDVGCGPGRMSAHLSRMGRLALGVDLVRDAVHQAVERGATALHRDVFAPLPGEGRWQTALLADGNVGIGGDPVALLRRLRAVISEDGRVVVDLTPPGTGLTTGWVRLGPSAAPAGRCAGPGWASTRSTCSPTTPASPWPPPTSTTGAGSRSWNGPRDAPAGRALLHLAAAQPGGDRAGRPLARHLLRRRVPDRADQPLRPDARPADPVPDAPVVGLPGHPGPARHRRYGGRARCSWSSSGPSTPSSSRRPPRDVRRLAPARRSSGSRSRSWWRPRSSSSPPACELRAVVPVGVQLPGHPLRGRAGSPSVRCVVHIAVKLPVIRAGAAPPTSRPTH